MTVAQAAGIIAAPRHRPCIGPLENKITAAPAKVVGDEGVVDAVVGQHYGLALGEIAEGAHDEARPGVLNHRQVCTEHRRKIECQVDRAIGCREAVRRDWHIRRRIERRLNIRRRGEGEVRSVGRAGDVCAIDSKMVGHAWAEAGGRGADGRGGKPHDW